MVLRRPLSCAFGGERIIFQKDSKIFYSKNFPTDPWSIPQTPNQQFMKEFLSFGGERGCLGYAKQGYVRGSLRFTVPTTSTAKQLYGYCRGSRVTTLHDPSCRFKGGKMTCMTKFLEKMGVQRNLARFLPI